MPLLVRGATTLSLVIPKEVEAKIRHLCSRVHDIEWSGTLFYKVEGSFDDGSFKATCLDICVMDIGSAGFTQYDDTADIVAYRIDHPELLQEGVYEGLIHSHNNMSAFFSGTDSNTLLAEGDDLNHFLSLVVCNNGPYVARITRKVVKHVEAKAQITYTETSFYNTYENRRVDVADAKVTHKEQEDTKDIVLVEWFDLNITKETVEEPFSELDQRLSTIRANKAKKLAENAKKVTYNPSSPYNVTVKPLNTPWKGSDKTPEGVSYMHEQKTPVKNYEPVQSEQGELFPVTPATPATPSTHIGDDVPPMPLPLIESVDEGLIKEMCTQLVVGSILVDASQIDVEKWTLKMDSLYEKRFGDLNITENCKALENWIEIFTEQILNTSCDLDMETRVPITYGDEYDDDDFTQLYAYEMIKFLYDLPDSLVKDMMIDELKTYIPDELEGYL